MSEDLDVDNDVFLEGGVLSCVCGQSLEEDEAVPLIKTEGRKQFIACPTCDMRHWADGGLFRLDN